MAVIVATNYDDTRDNDSLGAGLDVFGLRSQTSENNEVAFAKPLDFDDIHLGTNPLENIFTTAIRIIFSVSKQTCWDLHKYVQAHGSPSTTGGLSSWRSRC